MQNVGWYERNEVRELPVFCCDNLPWKAAAAALLQLEDSIQGRGIPYQGPEAPFSTFMLTLARKHIGPIESF